MLRLYIAITRTTITTIAILSSTIIAIAITSTIPITTWPAGYSGAATCQGGRAELPDNQFCYSLNLSYRLNSSLKGGYKGDSIGDGYVAVVDEDSRSLDHS